MDASAKDTVISTLQQANNILVTVSANPSVDQLSAMIGLTLLINKAEKHGAAVFSGQVPSTIEFLEPEQTVEKNTDSLRDFIISLDKSKADKLRYKVEDDVVKIFVTPYHTSLSPQDFEFSQGDFNVDVVVALGVAKQDELDAAITAHGRILHDAKVIAITNSADANELGAIVWQDTSASSLCEMIAVLTQSMQAGLLDAQISTALLTGIVAQTERFRNDHTSPQTMTLAAQLMAAGANQQLIANKLETPAQPMMAPSIDQDAAVAQANTTGVLQLEHSDEELHAEKTIEPITENPAETNLAPTEPVADNAPPENAPAAMQTPATVPAPEQPKPFDFSSITASVPTIANSFNSSQPTTQPSNTGNDFSIHIDEQGNVNTPLEESSLSHSEPIIHGMKVIEPLKHDENQAPVGNSMALTPPTTGGDLNFLTALNQHNDTTPPVNSFTMDTPKPSEAASSPAQTPAPAAQITEQPAPQVAEQPPIAPVQASVDNARSAVADAFNKMPFDSEHPEPIKALNAQPIDLNTSQTEQKPEDKPQETQQNQPNQQTQQSPPPVPPPLLPNMPGGMAPNSYVTASAPAPAMTPVMPQ